MRQEKVFWASVAIASLAVGIGAFITGSYLHQLHILGVPSRYVAAVAFVVSNFAVTAFLTHNLPVAHLPMKALVSVGQAVILLAVLCVVQFAAPVGLLMLQSMMFPTLGIILLGIGAMVAAKATEYPFAAPHV